MAKRGPGQQEQDKYPPSERSQQATLLCLSWFVFFFLSTGCGNFLITFAAIILQYLKYLIKKKHTTKYLNYYIGICLKVKFNSSFKVVPEKATDLVAAVVQVLTKRER